MNLQDIKREYDAIISIGASCQVAYHLKRKNLRRFSGPFDWFTFNSLANLNKALGSQFNDFMKNDNLFLDGIEGDNFLIRDRLYDCISVHDFPVTYDNNDWKDFYPDFNRKLNKRISRFLDKIKNSKSILFVRAQGNLEEVKVFKDIIHSITESDFNVLLVNYSTEERVVVKDCDINVVCSVEIPNNNERWQGYDEAWDELLEGITISENSVQNDDVFNAKILPKNDTLILKKGSLVYIKVKIKNISKTTWDIYNMDNKLNLGNHWLDMEGNIIIHDDGRSAILRILEPDDEIDVNIRLKAPDEIGNYIVELDLVKEGHTWFKEKGSKTAKLKVTVI